MSKGWQRFAFVEVSVSSRGVEAKPPEVELRPNAEDGQDSVCWVIYDFPEDKERVEIKWEMGSPFLNLGVAPVEKLPEAYREAKLALIGTGNTKEKNLFKYDVVFVGADGKTIGLDPRIRNEPEFED